MGRPVTVVIYLRHDEATGGTKVYDGHLSKHQIELVANKACDGLGFKDFALARLSALDEEAQYGVTFARYTPYVVEPFGYDGLRVEAKARAPESLLVVYGEVESEVPRLPSQEKLDPRTLSYSWQSKSDGKGPGKESEVTFGPNEAWGMAHDQVRIRCDGGWRTYFFLGNPKVPTQPDLLEQLSAGPADPQDEFMCLALIEAFGARGFVNRPTQADKIDWSFSKVGVIESVIAETAKQAQAEVVLDDQVDMSAYDGAITIYRYPDGSRLAWFRLSGLEGTTSDMDQIPSHFDNVVEAWHAADVLPDWNCLRTRPGVRFWVGSRPGSKRQVWFDGGAFDTSDGRHITTYEELEAYVKDLDALKISTPPKGE